MQLKLDADLRFDEDKWIITNYILKDPAQLSPSWISMLLKQIYSVIQKIGITARMISKLVPSVRCKVARETTSFSDLPLS